jgi:hypothetical protein
MYLCMCLYDVQSEVFYDESLIKNLTFLQLKPLVVLRLRIEQLNFMTIINIYRLGLWCLTQTWGNRNL